MSLVLVYLTFVFNDNNSSILNYFTSVTVFLDKLCIKLIQNNENNFKMAKNSLKYSVHVMKFLLILIILNSSLRYSVDSKLNIRMVLKEKENKHKYNLIQRNYPYVMPNLLFLSSFSSPSYSIYFHHLTFRFKECIKKKTRHHNRN